MVRNGGGVVECGRGCGCVVFVVCGGVGWECYG